MIVIHFLLFDYAVSPGRTDGPLFARSPLSDSDTKPNTNPNTNPNPNPIPDTNPIPNP